MTSITHWDGADVVMFDVRSRFMAAIDEVRLAPDRAVVLLRPSCIPRELIKVKKSSYAIHSARDGQLHWEGRAVRLALNLLITR